MSQSTIKPDIAAVMGSLRLSDALIKDYLKSISFYDGKPAPSLDELRITIQKEMGDRNLTDELLNLRNEE